MASTPPKKPKYDTKRAWAEARALLWEHRKSVGTGLALMLVSRAASFVLPLTPKYLYDEVMANRRYDLLWPIALVGFGATLINAITSYALSQIVSVAAQQAIALPTLFAPGDTVYLEKGTFLEPMAPQLRALGHAKIDTRPPLTFKGNAIERVAGDHGRGRWVGAADPRSEGAAVSE